VGRLWMAEPGLSWPRAFLCGGLPACVGLVSLSASRPALWGWSACAGASGLCGAGQPVRGPSGLCGAVSLSGSRPACVGLVSLCGPSGLCGAVSLSGSRPACVGLSACPGAVRLVWGPCGLSGGVRVRSAYAPGRPGRCVL